MCHIFRDNIPIGISDIAEYHLIRDNKTIDVVHVESDSITDDGKREILELLGGLDNKPINTMWARVNDQLHSTNVTLQGTCDVGSIGTLTIIGDEMSVYGSYSGVFTGYSSGGSTLIYSSIPLSVTLTEGDRIRLIVKWIFSGFPSDSYGANICVSRLGNLSNDCNRTISHVAGYLSDTLKGIQTVSNSITGNTVLVCKSTDQFNTPIELDTLRYQTSNQSDPKYLFTRIEDFNINIDTPNNGVIPIAYFRFVGE